MRPNLFATVLTHAAPSSNYRGESEENRTIIQKITKGDHEYPIISPESMRNALREMLATKQLPHNRTRLYEEEQLAVEFKAHPDAAVYADDFLFGFMVADKDAVKAMSKAKKPAKRDSVLRMNMAVALLPYRFDASFHQSPLNAGVSTWKNSSSSALLHREVAYTAFQYPFALNLEDCAKGGATSLGWTRALLESIGELSNVAGGHARSLYEMAPRSIVLRATRTLASGFNPYGFAPDGTFSELSRLNANDLPPAEFTLGGEVVRALDPKTRKELEAAGASLFDSPQRAIESVATKLELPAFQPKASA